MEPGPTPTTATHEGHGGHAGHGGHGTVPTTNAEQPKSEAPRVPPGESPKPDGPGPSPAVVVTDAVMERYFELSNALVKDDFAGAAAVLAPLRAAADELAHAADANTAAAAARVRDAVPKDPGGIADLRTGLKSLSDAVIALVRAVPPTDAVGPLLRLDYCPMADASWLQAGREIQNPYMGQRMPHCGRVVEAIETRATKGGK